MSYSEELLGLQNSDGGWGYRRGSSWTEPTCYSLLALLSSGESPELHSEPALAGAFGRAAAWLSRRQGPDGGLAPRESVGESTWLTALALLLPPSATGTLDRTRAARWVLDQTGRESGWVNRLRLWMLGVNSEQSITFEGWPWYPGTAAWIAPTAVSVLALERVAKEKSDPDIEKRIAQGRAFLLARRCRDGGWNHGSTKALGYDSDSYPESTGLALLALHASNGPEVEQGIRRAEQHLSNCRSQEAANWLRLGLLAHGRKPQAPELAGHGRTLEIAMAALADAAQNGRNWFLS